MTLTCRCGHIFTTDPDTRADCPACGRTYKLHPVPECPGYRADQRYEVPGRIAPRSGHAPKKERNRKGRR